MVTVLLADLTPLSSAVWVSPAGTVKRAAPELTVAALDTPSMVQSPPSVALPQPERKVLAKVSLAIALGLGVVGRGATATGATTETFSGARNAALVTRDQAP